MYCSSCGAAVKPGSIYCKGCGAEMNATDRDLTKLSPTFPESLVWGLVVVAVGGLAMMIGLMAVLKDVLGFDNELILLISLLGFLLLIGAEGVLIWMVLRFRRGAKERSAPAQPKGVVTNELGDAPARTLPEPQASVTEHTTRALETVISERQAD